MLTLAIDTCLPACGVALAEDGRLLARRFEPMARGHQERLGTLVAEVMAEAARPFAALDRIGVTIGPGSFTGLRVGLAFAKGLGVALGKPLVGVGSLEALAASLDADGLVVALADARRGQAYWQAFVDGRPVTAPAASRLEDVAAFVRAQGRAARLTGPGAWLLAPLLPDADVAGLIAPNPDAIAGLAEKSEPSSGTIRPIYLRTPDAKLPGGIDPPRPVGVEEAAALAAVHGEAFDTAWSSREIADLLVQDGVVALAVEAPPIAFVLCRSAGGEGEILTIATAPSARRRGLGRALLAAARRELAAVGVSTLFLEVAEDNEAALRLYRAAGFSEVGRRVGYYARAGGSVDALTLRCDLNSTEG